jgi:hypothetical protein
MSEPAENPIENPSEHTGTQHTGSQYTQTGGKRPWFKIVLMAIGGAVVGLAGIVTFTIVMEGREGLMGGNENKPPMEPQLSATEIITQEFEGKIETAPVDPESLTQPALELPTTAELGSRDFIEPSERETAAVDKSPLQLKLDKGASKVSKNLDKKKVMGLLAKKLGDGCQPALPEGTSSVKAEIKVSSKGAISNIKVTPREAEAELAKCMRKKLGEAKDLKPKNKKTAKITVQFEVK